MTSDQDARPQQADTAGETPPLPPPPGTRYPVRHRPRLPWLIAVVVVLVLAAAVTITLVIRANRDQSAKQPTTPSSRPSASTATASGASSSIATSVASSPATSGNASPSGSAGPVTPPLLARGKEAPAGAIPWSQVNAGWRLADWTSKSNLHQGPEPLYTLYLVNPIGGRYRIATLPLHSIVSQWSPDLRRAIVTAYTNPQVLREYDLGTGRLLAGFQPGNRHLVGYAGPSGHSLLLSVPGPDNQTGRLELVSTAGVHQAYLPGSTPQAGPFREPALYTPGGSTFLIGGQHEFAVISNSGAVVRQIPFPGGTQYCQLARWLTSGTAIADCSTGTSVYNLFSIPLVGGTPTAITHAPPPEYGYSTGWRFSGGTVAEQATSCGPGGLDVIDSAGHAQPYRYHAPPGVSGRAAPVDVYADQVSLVTGTCGEPSGSLFSLDLRTSATSTLLGPGLNGGSVANVVTAAVW